MKFKKEFKMKKIILLAAMMLIMFAIMVGCGKKADEATDKVPVETKAADMMDSTRMDSASHMMDSTMMDSMKAKGDGHEGHDH